MAQGDTQAEGFAIAGGTAEAIQPPSGNHWSVRTMLSENPDELELMISSGGNIEAGMSLFKGTVENIPVNNDTFVKINNPGSSSCVASYHAVERR